MKKLSLLLVLMISFSYSQTSDPGVTSTGAAAGDHAFVGTYADGVFSDWLGTGTSATAYNLLGNSNQHAGFGVAEGTNVVSPLIWMYTNNNNAFRVRTINYDTDLTSGTDLFTVRATGNVGIGTTTPGYKLDVIGTGKFSTLLSTSGGITSMVSDNQGDSAVKGITQGSEDVYGILGYAKESGGPLYGVYADGNGYGFSGVFMNGNVGIGTELPLDKLHVNEGNIRIFGETTSRYLRFTESYLRGAYINYDAANNMFHIGVHEAGDNNITNDLNVLTMLRSTGYVGIGTETPDAKLAVNGNIHTKEVKVDLIGWSDFVFDSDYNLPTLKAVEQHIKEKGHLKDIPSAEDVEKNGIFLGDMDAKLLQKIEELTLYTIDQEKRIERLETQNKKLIALLEKLADKKSE